MFTGRKLALSQASHYIHQRAHALRAFGAGHGHAHGHDDHGHHGDDHHH